MQKSDYTAIFTTKRYEYLLAFFRILTNGQGRTKSRTLLKSAMNELVSRNVAAMEKVELLMGAQKVNTLLAKVLTDDAYSSVLEFEDLIPKESDRYLLLKVFDEENGYIAPKLEGEVVANFEKLAAAYLAQRKAKFSGSFQDIVDLIRSVVDDVVTK